MITSPRHKGSTDFFKRQTALEAPVLSKVFNLLILTYFAICIWLSIPEIIFQIEHFESWNISEFLVNFKGGFIRRGAVGELLYWVVKHTGIDPRLIIVPVCIACFGFVLSVMIRALRRYGLRWWLLGLPYCFAYLNLCLIRKDFINLSLIALMLWFYARTDAKPVMRVLVATIISVGIVLINEAAYFMIVPFMYLLVWRDPQMRGNTWLKVFYPTVTMGVMAGLFLCTGNPDAANTIHQSWHQLMPDKIDPNVMGLTTQCVGWSLHHALRINECIFLIGERASTPYEYAKIIIIFVLMIFVGTYVLINYMYQAKSTEARRFPLKRKVFASLVFVQLISLSPMFLGLSGDFTRVFMYLYVVPIMVVYYLPSEKIEALMHGFIESTSEKIINAVDRIIPHNIYVLFGFMTFGYGCRLVNSVFCRIFLSIKSLISGGML